MKKLNITFLLTMLISMVGLNASAHDIEVKNADGKTIYYNFINDNTELAVTCRGSFYDSYSNEYAGNVVIPESVTYNEKTYSVTSIEGSAFRGCSKLTSVTIPNSVTSIGNFAFYGCSILTSVTIGSGVTSIGNYAFEYCSGLTSVTIGTGVTSIGDEAFYGCSGLKKVIAPDIAAWCGIKFGSVAANPLHYAHHLYSDDNTEITELVIPDGVTSIGSHAFFNCSGLTSITIPNSVTSIGINAFYNCSGLTSVTIGSGVTSIGDYAFSGCSGLTSVTIGSGVTSIGYWTFYNCSGLTSITIPNSVTSIGESAFHSCSGLTSVTIGSGVTNIGGYAFYNTAWYNNLPDGLVYAGKVAYKYKGTMPENTSITIKDGTLGIAGEAFRGCSKLTSVTIPNSVTSIETSAFSGCSGLTSVTIPNSVTSIGESAFSGCSGLTSVTIPNSVTSIGNWAFSSCSGLTSIDIPNSVTSIGEGAFSSCSGLQSVYNNAENAFTIPKNTFSDATYSSATLYVPTGMKATYEDTPWWANFNKMEEYDFPTGITIPQQSKDVKVVDAYQINGLKTGSMQKGLNILKMSDGTTRKVVK